MVPADNMEPIELQKLKRKLATLSCDCHNCIKTKTVINEGVQVEEPRRLSVSQYTQADPQTINKDHYNFLNTLTKDVLCPSCFVTMNLLRGGALKVLKDQESETRQLLFSCDKATTKSIAGLEKSTSVTKRSDINQPSVSFCDNISDVSSKTSVSKHDRRSSEPEVTFHDVGINEVHRDELIHGHGCLCLENFIESIRPPLNGFMNSYRP